MPPIHLQLAIHGIVGVPTSKKGVSVRFDRELEQFTSVAEIFHPVPVGLCRATELKQCCTRGNTLHKRVYSRDPEYFSEQTSELIAAPKKKKRFGIKAIVCDATCEDLLQEPCVPCVREVDDDTHHVAMPRAPTRSHHKEHTTSQNPCPTHSRTAWHPTRSGADGREAQEAPPVSCAIGRSRNQ